MSLTITSRYEPTLDTPGSEMQPNKEVIVNYRSSLLYQALQRLFRGHGLVPIRKMDVDADLEQVIHTEQHLRDKWAPAYDGVHVWEEWRLRVLDVVFDKCLKPRFEHTILDAGCGTGRNLPWLSMKAGRVIGADHSARSLEIAGTRVADSERARSDRVELIVADLRQLPLADASVDRVVCAQVIQHIPGHDNRRAVAREFYRVLRPGGIAVISAWRWRGGIKRRKEGFLRNTQLYVYAFTVHEFAELWEQVGFSDVRVGGTPVLSKLSEVLNIKPEVQLPLVFSPIGRKLGYHVIACVHKPDGPL